MRVVILILSVLNPLLIVNEHETNKDKLRKQLLENAEDLEISKTLQHGKKLKKAYASFLRKDLGFEVVLQVSGQILLLLLSHSKTATTSGLETVLTKDSIFGISSQIVLLISVLLSIKTCILPCSGQAKP